MIQKSKGLFYDNDKIEVFFGNKDFSLHELTGLRPLGVHAVKQTHSDIFHVIDREEPFHPQPEGDALGSSLRKQYLVIKTADCLPVMIYAPDLNRVAAVHAGWKGVAIGIVPKTIAKYFAEAQRLQIFVGPHITKNSFEIKDDVLAQLKSSLPTEFWNKVHVETRAERYHVDLVEVVKLQIESGFPNIKFEIENSNVDTKTNSDFNSFRRDAKNAGRNISYIKLK